MEEAGGEEEREMECEEVKEEERKKRRDVLFAEDARRGVKRGGKMRRWKRMMRKRDDGGRMKEEEGKRDWGERMEGQGVNERRREEVHVGDESRRMDVWMGEIIFSPWYPTQAQVNSKLGTWSRLGILRPKQTVNWEPGLGWGGTR